MNKVESSLRKTCLEVPPQHLLGGSGGHCSAKSSSVPSPRGALQLSAFFFIGRLLGLCLSISRRYRSCGDCKVRWLLQCSFHNGRPRQNTTIVLYVSTAMDYFGFNRPLSSYLLKITRFLLQKYSNHKNTSSKLHYEIFKFNIHTLTIG